MAFRDLDRPPLDGSALRAALITEGSFWREIVVTTSTGSTNVCLLYTSRCV